MSETQTDVKKSIAEEVPQSVELREVGLSFTLPTEKKISSTFRRELRTQMQTRLRVALSSEKLTLSCSPPLLVDAQWPAQNMDLGAVYFTFADANAKVIVSSISGLGEGLIDYSDDARKEVGAMVVSAMAGTPAALPGYLPFEDPAWRATLDAVIENLRRQPSSGSSDTSGHDFSNPRLDVSLALRTPFLFESEGGGLSMPAGAVFGVEISGIGNFASILAAETLAEKTRAAEFSHLTITSDSIFVLIKGKPVAALDRVRVDKGGAVTLEEMRLLGILGQAEGLESLFRAVASAVRLVDAGVSLPDAENATALGAIATLVPALAAEKIEEALSEGTRVLVRERANTIPGLDLCEVFGI